MGNETRKEPITPYEKIYYDYIDLLEKNSKELLDKDNWMLLFNVLDKLHIHEDYVLDDYRSKGSNNNILDLYARPKSIKRPSEEDFFRWEYNHTPLSADYSPLMRKFGLNSYNIFEQEKNEKIAETAHMPAMIDPLQVISLEDDGESIWQALLLDLTYHFIGQRWHGGYARRKLIFCKTDLPEIESERRIEKYGPMPDFDDSIFLPKVCLEHRDECYVQFCWWSSWGGLSKIKAPFYHSYAHKTILFRRFEIENLYEFDCGIRF